ncbi:Nepenthesin [Bertholletia excelsa]
MAREKSAPFLPLILCFLLIQLGFTGEASRSGEKEALSLQSFQWQRKNRIASCSSQKSRQENGATILEMQPKDYCSGTITGWKEFFQKRLISDDIRVRALQSRLRNLASAGIQQDLSQSQTQIPLNSGIKLQTLNYIVTVELGGRNMTLIVDTGSDLTWVQCQPCSLCYNQLDPLFDPSKSGSYHSVPCNSPSCQSLQFATGNSGVCGGGKPLTTCNYLVSYGDGSYTRGELAQDNLRLGANPVEGFVFGCGRNNKGLFGGASGLMGLGKSDLSMVSQTSRLFGAVFSYCLPSTEAGTSGSLVFGGDYSVYKNSTPVTFTRMVPNPQLSTFYFLNLTGVSIGGVVLEVPSFGNGVGVLIDSGTVITRLAPSLYRTLKAEFLKQFSGFLTAPAFSILDTCFDLSRYQEVNIPTVSMHFEGDSELNVDVNGIFYFVKGDASQVCLALASLSYEDEIPIIGNYQQRNTRVVYDTKGSKLGFAKESCSFT